MSRVWISKIKINNGTEIELDKNDIVVFVGPNNSGKSSSLKEIDKLLKASNQSSIIIKNIEIEKDSNDEEFTLYVEKFSKVENDNYRGFGFNIHKNNAKAWWQNHKNGLQELHNIFVNFLSTESRLSAANPATNIQITVQPPQHPIHFLQIDDKLEFKFSSYFHQAFGEDLIVHRNAGNIVPLYIGSRPVVKTGVDRVSKEYLEELEKLPTLHSQGDGMRSFVGILLSTIIENYSIQLVDEPEAFLHPPQAKLLGRMLAKDLKSDKQLFFSTHSEDFINGLLDSGNNNIKIIRLRRNKNINNVSFLDQDEIKKVWSDSLLRYSNILNGLFHDKVFLCESDSDCRFYSAVLDSLYDDENKNKPDVLFIHCGGKHRMPIVVNSLKKLGVPISVIADFDVLNNENPIKDLVLNLGGDWGSVKTKFENIKKSIETKKSEIEKEELKTKLDELFSSIQTNVLSETDIQNISKLTKKASPWSYAKEVGKSFIPSGDATKDFMEINEYLNSIGLFIVEVGELEGFVKSVGNHGPKWINEVLSKNLKTDPELEEARNFLTKLVSD